MFLKFQVLLRGRVVVTRGSHNPKVGGSIPSPATFFVSENAGNNRSDVRILNFGQVSKWLKGVGCKPIRFGVREFESHLDHSCGANSSVG